MYVLPRWLTILAEVLKLARKYGRRNKRLRAMQSQRGRPTWAQTGNTTLKRKADDSLQEAAYDVNKRTKSPNNS